MVKRYLELHGQNIALFYAALNRGFVAVFSDWKHLQTD
jgi:hypothetical protein